MLAGLLSVCNFPSDRAVEFGLIHIGQQMPVEITIHPLAFLPFLQCVPPRRMAVKHKLNPARAVEAFTALASGLLAD